MRGRPVSPGHGACACWGSCHPPAHPGPDAALLARPPAPRTPPRQPAPAGTQGAWGRHLRTGPRRTLCCATLNLAKPRPRGRRARARRRPSAAATGPARGEFTVTHAGSWCAMHADCPALGTKSRLASMAGNARCCTACGDSQPSKDAAWRTRLLSAMRRQQLTDSFQVSDIEDI